LGFKSTVYLYRVLCLFEKNTEFWRIPQKHVAASSSFDYGMLLDFMPGL